MPATAACERAVNSDPQNPDVHLTLGDLRRQTGRLDAAVTEYKATLAQDKAKLEQLLADQVSYGHSGGRVENKTEVINGVMNRKSVVKSIDFPELKVAVVGNGAVARHLWVSQSEMDGKPTTTKIGVLQVWQKQDGNWKLLARQGYKLEA